MAIGARTELQDGLGLGLADRPEGVIQVVMATGRQIAAMGQHFTPMDLMGVDDPGEAQARTQPLP